MTSRVSVSTASLPILFLLAVGAQTQNVAPPAGKGNLNNGTSTKPDYEFSTDELISDLGPLLALFGEQFAQQFMCESTGWLDNIVFAMAPLGIIAAVSGAIRISGPSWIKAVAGKARENRAAAEVELVSSTSHEVGELFNGSAIVRTIGSPQVAQLVYLHPLKDEASLGWYTTKEAIEEGYLQSEPCVDPLTSRLVKPFVWTRNILRRLRSKKPEPVGKPDLERKGSFSATVRSGHTESTISMIPQQPEYHPSAPNISLNVHGGSRTWELMFAAFLGILLEFGVLTLAGVTTYHSTLRPRFKRKGKLVEPHGFPLFSLGTIFVDAGMLVCAALIEKSTVEKRIVPTPKYLRLRGDKQPEVRVLWLQNQGLRDLGDEMSPIDSFVLFNPTPMDKILTSRRNRVFFDSDFEFTQNSMDDVTTQSTAIARVRTMKSVTSTQQPTSRLKRIASSPKEMFTLVGVFLGVSGFVLQFQGLRALHWSISLARLVAVAIATVLRAWVRRGLIRMPVAKRVLPEHGGDWLALRVNRGASPGPTSLSVSTAATLTDGLSFWPETQEELEREEQINRRGRRGTIALQGRAAQGPHGTLNDLGLVPHPPSRRSTIASSFITTDRLQWRVELTEKGLALPGSWGTAPEVGAAQEVLRVRQRLGRLTQWKGKASEPAIAVSRAIDAVMNALIPPTGFSVPFTWHLNVLVNDHEESISFLVEPTEDGWRADATQIEAALSLWLYDLDELGSRARLDCPVEDCKESDWLRRDVQFRRQAVRRLGPDTKDMQRDLSWWMPDGLPRLLSADSRNNENRIVVGFKGVDKSEQDANKDDYLAVNAEAPVEYLFAQHLFSAFVWGVAAYVKPTWLLEGGHTNVINRNTFDVESPETLYRLRFSNNALADTAGSIAATGLMTLTEAYLTLIPPLSDAKALQVDLIVDIVRDEARDHEARGHWKQILSTYTELHKICKSMGRQRHVSHRAAALLTYVYHAANNSLKIRKTQPRHANTIRDTQIALDSLLEELKTHDGETLLNLLRMYRIHAHRQMAHELGGVLGIPIEEIDDESADTAVHNFFGHHQEMRLLGRKDTIHTAKKAITPSNANLEDVLGWTALHYSAMFGDDEMTQTLLDSMGAEPSRRDIAEKTALRIAVEFENVQVIWVLLQAGMDIDQTDRAGVSPLHIAVKMGNLEIVNLLLQAGANAEAKDSTRKTPLYWAAYYTQGENPTIELLLNKSAFCGARDDYGRTILAIAALLGVSNIVRQLLRIRKIEIDAVDLDGRTALQLAAIGGDMETLNLLLESTSATESLDPSGKTLLHLAAQGGCASMVQRLLDRGAEVNRVDYDGYQPLHQAALVDRAAFAHALIKSGADINAVVAKRTPHAMMNTAPHIDRVGYTALAIAAKEGHIETVQTLISLGAAINPTRPDRPVTIIIAALAQHEAIIHLLARSGADINVANASGLTALHACAYTASASTIELLLSLGAYIECRDHAMRTPLHIAATSQDLRLDAILRHNPNIEAHTIAGFTALHIAAAAACFPSVEKLVQRGANVNSVTTVGGWTPLLLAAMSPGKENDVTQPPTQVLEYLLDHGADILARSSDGWGVLHCVTRFGTSGAIEKLRFLLERGLDVNVENGDDLTPATLARMYGHHEVLAFLVQKGARIASGKDEDLRRRMEFVVPREDVPGK